MMIPLQNKIKFTERMLLDLQLPDYEANKLRAAINEQISRLDNEEAQKTLGRVFNKLSPNPIIASITEELAGRDFKDIAELQKEVSRINQKYNDSPDPEMAGLSPNQVFRLVHLPWNNENFAIRFNKQIEIEDVQDSYFYSNARTLLNTLIELEGEYTATVAGNLSRKVLRILFDRIILRESDRVFFREYDNSFNESNAYTVYETRIVCQLANLIRKIKRKFIVAKKQRSLLLDENAGKLYYLLFTTFFRRFNIAYRDGFPALYSIQSTICFSFYVIERFCDDFCSINDLEQRIFLPAVRKEIISQSRRDWDLKGLIHTRIIEPLISFGLIEVVRGEKRSVFNVEAIKKTRLFDKFMEFSV